MDVIIGSVPIFSINNDKIIEWNFIMTCVKCGIYYPIFVNNKNELIKSFNY